MPENKKDTNYTLNSDGEMENPLVSLADDENLPALSNPALHRYLQEISQYELLTREETDELATRFKESGDQNAAYRLVSSNLRETSRIYKCQKIKKIPIIRSTVTERWKIRLFPWPMTRTCQR